MNDLTLLSELEQKIVKLIDALKSEKDKNSTDNSSLVESQKLSKIEEHVNNMIKIIDDVGKSK